MRDLNAYPQIVLPMAASGGGSVCVETAAYHRGAAAQLEQHGEAA